ncbi:MAG TPA: hypothetical protein VFW40_05430 [Capsulimonadaceae bacterium]|nr:hypothetical protein [Capsulimonadaceae bacterium]
MRISSKVLLAIVVVAVVALLVISHRSAPPSDQAQIAAQTASALAAANRHNVYGVMGIISANYHDENGYTNDFVHTLLIRAMRGAPTERVTLSGQEISVQGDTASSQGYLDIQDAQSGRTLYSQEITLQWQKEPARSFIVFPTHVWRIVSASYGSIGADTEIGI